MKGPLLDMKGVIVDKGTSDGNDLIPAKDTSLVEEDEKAPDVGAATAPPPSPPRPHHSSADILLPPRTFPPLPQLSSPSLSPPTLKIQWRRSCSGAC